MTNEPLRIKKAVFHTSMKKKGDYPGGSMPEIAVAGKSNCGKSSLINYLANNSKLAYVGKQPGKTRLINYFVINDTFYLVDLPGYGFAKVAKSEKKSWSEMMRGYFDVAKELTALIILTDIRHDPSEDDLQMIEWAAYFGIPFLIVATKADKIAKSKRYHHVVKIAKAIDDALELPMEYTVLPVSSLEKKGKEELLEYMRTMIKTGEEK